MSSSDHYQGRLPDGRCLDILVEHGKIAELRDLPADDTLPYVLPPLVDIQQNGALGVYMHRLAELGPEPLYDIVRFLRRHGVGRSWLTTASAPAEELAGTYKVVNQALNEDRSLAAFYPAIFHEGIYMSPEDGWRGAHPKECIFPPDYDQLQYFDELSGGRIQLINVAPEVEGGLDFIERAVADGKLITLGHACPDADTISAAIDRGATWVTHFGNGAAPQIHRFRNPFWSYLAREELSLMIICDGFHLPPEFVQTVFHAKDSRHIVPVSDASGYSGYPPGRYHDGTYREFEISDDGWLHLADSELLMGAWFQLDRGVEYLVEHLGMSLPDAWHQCSRVPAEAFGVDLPALAVGEEASFVLAHWDEGLVLDQSVQLGDAYLQGPIRPTNVDNEALNA